MRSAENIEKLVKNLDLGIDTNAQTDQAVLAELLDAQKKSMKQQSAFILQNIRRFIMKSPITKLAATAVIIALVVLGLFELTGTESTSGVVWAEVARKVQASLGSIVRCRATTSFQPSDETDYSIRYTSQRYSRKDVYKAGQITESYYEDFDTNTMTYTMTYFNHIHKHYMSRTFNKNKNEFFLEQHDQWMNPRYLVQRILSGEHRNLGQKTIEGISCEGIETTDPAALGPLPGPINRLEVEMRLWVNVETGYPVLFENKMSGEAEGKSMESEWVMDQFQWDVELDPSFLEPNIPPDYVDMRSL